MKSKPATKSITPNADRVIRKVAPKAAPTLAPKAAVVRQPRARKAATVPDVVQVANDMASDLASGVATNGAPAAVPPEHVVIRAYELFVAHGREHGHDLEHWLAAEREILGRS